MKIARSGLPTSKASAEWFTGDVYVDQLVAPEGGFARQAVASSTSPPERAPPGTPIPSVKRLFVLEGVGRCRRKGASGRKRFDRATGSTSSRPKSTGTARLSDRFMTHVAVLQTDDQGVSTVWGQHRAGLQQEIAG